MTKIEFAADRHPEAPARYGIVALVNGGVVPVGPQNYPSESGAQQAFLRAIGDAMKPSPA